MPEWWFSEFLAQDLLLRMTVWDPLVVISNLEVMLWSALTSSSRMCSRCDARTCCFPENAASSCIIYQQSSNSKVNQKGKKCLFTNIVKQNNYTTLPLFGISSSHVSNGTRVRCYVIYRVGLKSYFENHWKLMIQTKSIYIFEKTKQFVIRMGWVYIKKDIFSILRTLVNASELSTTTKLGWHTN